MARPMSTAKGDATARSQEAQARSTSHGRGLEGAVPSNYFSERLQHEISVAALRGHVDRADAPFLLVDVRPPEDYLAGHIVGAVSIAPEELVDALRVEFPGETELVVYGRDFTTLEATECAAVLAGAGYDVRELRGGFEAWTRHRHPVERGDPFAGDDY